MLPEIFCAADRSPMRRVRRRLPMWLAERARLKNHFAAAKALRRLILLLFAVGGYHCEIARLRVRLAVSAGLSLGRTPSFRLRRVVGLCRQVWASMLGHSGRDAFWFDLRRFVFALAAPGRIAHKLRPNPPTVPRINRGVRVNGPATLRPRARRNLNRSRRNIASPPAFTASSVGIWRPTPFASSSRIIPITNECLMLGCIWG